MRLQIVTSALFLSRKMSQKLVYPASERNKEPILNVLQQYLPQTGHANVLEISSGSGQHVAHFAQHFYNLTFQPSEFDTKLFDSINAYIKGVPNVRPPLHIDVTMDWTQWHLPNDVQYDCVLNSNMMHISPLVCTEGLFANCGDLLKPNGLLITYGPYANNGVIEPESNIRFDLSLRETDSQWGLRDIQHLQVLGSLASLYLENIHVMPSNNKCLIWRKKNVAD